MATKRKQSKLKSVDVYRTIHEFMEGCDVEDLIMMYNHLPGIDRVRVKDVEFPPPNDD